MNISVWLLFSCVVAEAPYCILSVFVFISISSFFFFLLCRCIVSFIMGGVAITDSMRKGPFGGVVGGGGVQHIIHLLVNLCDPVITSLSDI